jgi:hypothetical protein
VLVRDVVADYSERSLISALPPSVGTADRHESAVRRRESALDDGFIRW